MDILLGIVLCLTGILGGGLIGCLITTYYIRKQQDVKTAWLVVLAMSTQHPASDSRELQERVVKYLDALNRTKKDGRGVPVYREDGTIGVDWKLTISAVMKAKACVKIKESMNNEKDD